MDNLSIISKHQTMKNVIAAKKAKAKEKATKIQNDLMNKLLNKYESYYEIEKNTGVSRIQLQRWFTKQSEMNLSTMLYLKYYID